MRVLAIDPGYDRLGVAIMESGQPLNSLLFSTCLTSDKGATIASRIYELGQALEQILKDHQPDCVALESLFFNKNIKTALSVAEARGMILYLATKADLTVYEFNPTTVKLATTGYGQSDKTAVFSMLPRLVADIPKQALDDEYDAIAIGVTCLAEHRQSR